MVSTTLFVAFSVFSGTASSWIFNISASLMVAKRAAGLKHRSQVRSQVRSGQ